MLSLVVVIVLWFLVALAVASLLGRRFRTLYGPAIEPERDRG